MRLAAYENPFSNMLQCKSDTAAQVLSFNLLFGFCFNSFFRCFLNGFLNHILYSLFCNCAVFVDLFCISVDIFRILLDRCYGIHNNFLCAKNSCCTVGVQFFCIFAGKCFDTSMGLTPLAGIIMGSRTGDMDPAVVPFLLENYERVPAEHRPKGYETLTVSNVNNFMNKTCGLLGVSGTSSDMRAVIKEIETDEHGKAKEAKLAYDVLVYGIKKYIGAYAAAMDGVDAIVFTAGIGENNAAIRSDVCRNMSYLGIELDEEVNAAARGTITKLNSERSKVQVYLIPTDEELVIAKDTESIVKAL